MVAGIIECRRKRRTRKEHIMTTKAAAKTENSVTEPEAYDPTKITSWDVALRDADEILGHDLAKEELLDALEGVPFLITRMTFREADAGLARESYVTCEILLAPAPMMERRRVNLAMLPFDPGDMIVFNDGSTGIYRQCVKYLSAKGFITLPEDMGKEGPGPVWNKEKGKPDYACVYDLPPEQWTDIHAGEMRFTETGKGLYTVNVRCFAKRGIRISDGYENEWTKDGKTRYLA
jgi:hypothetical protein